MSARLLPSLLLSSLLVIPVVSTDADETKSTAKHSDPSSHSSIPPLAFDESACRKRNNAIAAHWLSEFSLAFDLTNQEKSVLKICLDSISTQELDYQRDTQADKQLALDRYSNLAQQAAKAQREGTTAEIVKAILIRAKEERARFFKFQQAAPLREDRILQMVELTVGRDRAVAGRSKLEQARSSESPISSPSSAISYGDDAENRLDALRPIPGINQPQRTSTNANLTDRNSWQAIVDDIATTREFDGSQRASAKSVLDDIMRRVPKAQARRNTTTQISDSTVAGETTKPGHQVGDVDEKALSALFAELLLRLDAISRSEQVSGAHRD